ncbi:hypothetical protein FA743_19290 [Paracoccus gahaiensis]|uniref:Uncharacterized protein n=1 Tax=Paracoccus gahaiensis TaxID=1706839 RepID=A0A4U0R4F7_9RHOB|nr:hypothetical protein [Paracoccus gahaiensis]TJZ89240.1 hypothetical protein FA743_19290 [Paracoccus gahaiensis]
MRLKKDPIGIDALEEYLTSASDFAFELRIFEMLTTKDIDCVHGGQYKDPDTGKFREFDLRARVTRGSVTLTAAIECKSVGKHFPLLVSCVPRDESEAFHQIFIHEPTPEEPSDLFHMPRVVGEGKEGVDVRPSQIYPVGGSVGKSTAQVGRRETKDAELHANDAEFFEKWSQALQSLDDLVYEVADDEFIQERWDGRLHVGLALPIVVVPNETLWSVNYASNGERAGQPAQTDRVSIYIARSYHHFAVGSLDISHLEVMTEAGLAHFCDTYLADSASIRAFLPRR